MTSQWLGVGAERDPLRRARELQRSWERLLADGALSLELPPGATAGLRSTIVESWRRSLAKGLDPTGLLAPIEADESEVLERWLEHPLGSLAHVLEEQLGKLAEESESVVVVTDASGLVLHRAGEEWLKERAAEMNLVEGARYSEAADGTNGIGTALAADHAFQVFAFEHFNERHHQWICSGAPVHDPVSGQTIGLIDLSSLWKVAHPGSLELVTTAARTIEQRLLEVRRDHDARLRRRYGDLMTRSTDLLVNRDGYVLAGAERKHSKALDVPEGGGEVALGDGSVAVAAALGQGEAYLLRRVTARRARTAPVEVLERAERHVRELVTEQSALRQVATLVARESAPDQLFAAVAEQVARVFAVPLVRLVRFEPEGSEVVGGFSEGDREPFPIGSRWPRYSKGAIAAVRQTGRPARMEDYGHLSGEMAAVFRDAGVHSTVASPIVVEGRLWGAMVVHSARHERLPESTEARLTDFTELVATAIANAESREALAALAGDQAALRRVATLVASGGGPDEIFRAVADEVQALFGSSLSGILRFEDDETATTLGTHGDVPTAGKRLPLDPNFVMGRVRTTRRAARFETDDPTAPSMPAFVRETGIRSAVASPILVEGELWGAIGVGSLIGSLPPGTERRLADFTDLVATAIANTQAREQVRALAEEHAALERVATLVAQGASPQDLFAAVAKEVGRLLLVGSATMGRYEPDDTVTTVASWSTAKAAFPIGKRWPMVGTNVASLVLRTGQAGRIDDFSVATDPISVAAREMGATSAAGSPIVVDGHLWGVMTVTSTDEPLPPDTEARLASFTELVATAIANTEARETLAQLADEQAALRRVATLVAEGVSQDTLFAAVAEEVAGLIGVDQLTIDRYYADSSTVIASLIDPGFPVGSRWPFDGPSLGRTVFETGRPARIDDYSELTSTAAEVIRSLGFSSTVGAPIIVEGRVWGVICVAASAGPLPADTEERLVEFTELVATAIANAEGRSKLGESEARALELAREQAALRRVATLVARDAAPGEVFDAVAMEVGELLDTDITVVGRYDADGAATAIGSWSASPGGVPVGTRSVVGGRNVLTLVAETQRPARVDGYDEGSGEAAEIARQHGWRSSIAAPIIVESRVWGVMLVATTRPEPFPAGAEMRLAAFTDLVATALANAQAHDEVRWFGEEQAALGHVATLVAAGAPPEQVFTAVVDEVSSLLGLEGIELVRYDGDRTGTVIAASGEHPFPAGSTWSLEDPSVRATVARTARAARIDDYGAMQGEIARLARSAGVHSAIGVPLTVEGRLWGAIIASSTDPEPISEQSEARLGQFTELVATAVANAEARQALERVAAEQAALRRVATLVAQGVASHALFEAVAEEVGRVFPFGSATMRRYEPDDTVTTVASWGTTKAAFPTGGRCPVEGTNVAWLVLQTGRPARLDDFSAATDPIGVAAREAGITSAVGSPIVVEGHLWGVMSANSTELPLPPDTEARLASFTELIATAIANAESSSELAASRRRIVAAADEARRRIERDLHDGIQQRLIALTFRARAMTRRARDELPGIAAELSEGLRDASDELREISRGIHPTILTEAGLGPALRALARRSDVAVEVDARLDGRLPTAVEAAAYYIASEALTNVSKHAHANVVELSAAHEGGSVTLQVRDDGVGGVDPGHGSGILGLTDRVEALGGTISIVSPPGGGTTLFVRLPVTT
jgi:GAF domain-containing protein